MPRVCRAGLSVRAPTGRESAASIVAVGALSGFAAGLLGIGGGAVSVVGLTAWARFSQHEAHATSLACIPAVAVVGAIVFGLDGSVAYLPGSILIAGAFAGVLLGARFMARLQAATLRRGFGLMMLAIAIRLLAE